MDAEAYADKYCWIKVNRETGGRADESAGKERLEATLKAERVLPSAQTRWKSVSLKAEGRNSFFFSVLCLSEKSDEIVAILLGIIMIGYPVIE